MHLILPDFKAMMADPSTLMSTLVPTLVPIAVGIGLVYLVCRFGNVKVFPALVIVLAGVILSSTFIGANVSELLTYITKGGG